LNVDLANALCKEMNATCTFTNQAFDSLIPSLKFRRVDAVMAGMDITPEHENRCCSHAVLRNSALLSASRFYTSSYS
jgi:ABC-type amino acid transport/signal transduction systems, periplasmic component/domain